MRIDDKHASPRSDEESATASEGTKTETSKPKQRRGFAAMDRAKVREIAHKGGIAAHEKGTAHRFSPEEARVAGQKGGKAPHRVRGRKLPPNRPAAA